MKVNVLWKISVATCLLVQFVPAIASAKIISIGGTTSCATSGCHPVNASTAVAQVAVKAGAASWVTYSNALSPAAINNVPAGATVELEWVWTGLNQKKGNTGAAIAIPTGWSITPSTAAGAGGLGLWHASYQDTTWYGGGTPTVLTADTPATHIGYASDYTYTSIANLDLGGLAIDDPGPDTVDGQMGAKVSVNIPSGATTNTYTIMVHGVGHVGSVKQSSITTITLNVIAAADTTDPVVATVTPANVDYNSTHVDATFDVSAAISEANTLSSCDICVATDGSCDTEWAAGSVGGSAPNWTCSDTGLGPYADAASLTINVRGTDGSSNVGIGSAVTRTVDAAAPTTGDDVTAGWKIADVTVTLTPSVGGSGIASTDYCVDQVDSCVPGTAYGAPFVVSTEGTNYVRYRSTDNVGNVQNVVSKTLQLDKSAPVDGTLTATPSDSQVDLSWTVASDAHSGLASPTYAIAKATGVTPPGNCDTPLTSTDLTSYTDNAVSNGTTYSYRICATNNAGLQSGGTTDSATPSAGNSNPNEPSNLAQYKSDGSTVIVSNGYTDEITVKIEADISDPNGGDTVKLQVDIDGNGSSDCESALAATPQTNVQVSCSVSNGISYDWQVRTVDNSAAISAWAPFAGSPDFSVDTVAPSVSSSTPADTDIDVALDSTVTIVFADGPLDCGTVDTGSITSTSPGWTFSTCNDTQAVFTTSGQANDTSYTVTVTTAVADKAGNTLAANDTISYTTVAAGNQPPTDITLTPNQVTDGTDTAVGFDMTLAAVDPDGGETFTFTKTGLGADQAKFTLIGTTVTLTDGVVSYDTPGDANADRVYEVEVQVEDSAANTYNETLLITIVQSFNPLIHSSLSTSSTKWGGDWGTATGKYGEFTCATCHTRLKADLDYQDNGAVYNIKRIKASLGTPDGTAWASAGTIAVDVQFTDANDTPSGVGFGDDNDPTGHTNSNKVCEVCHSQNKFHNYDTANNAPNGGDLLHENDQDCISCHEHSNGFDASCTGCHPTYPEPPATNAHVTHAGSTGYAYACTVCHPKDHDGDASDITFSGIAATWGAETYSGTVAKQCSNLYCHGGATADWDAGTGGTCGDCHGAVTTGRPDGANEPSGGSHLTTSHQVACTTCHSHDGSDKTEHVNGRANSNGAALVSSAGSSVTSYSYGASALASSPDPDGYSYTGGTCANSCHADGDWGAAGGCTFCHGGSNLYYPQTSTAPDRTAEHAAHIYALETKLGYTHGTTVDAEQKAMCAYCHNDVKGVGVTGHNDGGTAEVGDFNPMWDGGTSDADGALEVGKTCSNIDCHYSTTTADTWYGSGTAGCTYCHAGDVSYSAASLPDVHDAHVDEALDGGYNLSCATCHSASASYADDHANGSSGTDVGFSGAVATTWGSESYSGTAAKQCSSLYCHGGATADWDAGSGGACGDCHGAVTTGRPDGANEPAGGSHLTTSHQVACTTCHSHDGSDKAEHVNGRANANGAALVSSAGSSVTSYSYGASALASSPDPDGYSYTGGTCANSCHADGDWGAVGGCTFCHGGSNLYYPQTSTAPDRTAEHAAHIYALETKLGYTHGTTVDAEQKAMCAYCHNDVKGVGVTGHNDGGTAEVGEFNPMWDGGTADADGALDAGKTCSNIDCHYSTTTADTWYGTGNADCTYCHAGDVSYAAASLPGVHDAHVDEVADGGRDKTCVTCHSASATYAQDHADGGSGSDVAFSGSTSYTYNSTEHTCGTATNNGLGCHATGSPDWDVPFAITVCMNCHTNTTTAAVNPTSGLHAASPTISGQAHNQSLGGSGCASCHAVAALSTHANGTFTGNGTVAADQTAMGLTISTTNGYAATADGIGSCVGTWLTGCHSGAGDLGSWARRWNASISYDPLDADYVECAGCHGGFASDWTFGTDDVDGDGSVSHDKDWDGTTPGEVIGNHPDSTDKCKSCHGFGYSGVYDLATMGAHRDGKITFNDEMSYNDTTFYCGTYCHSDNSNHKLEDSGWSTTANTVDGPPLACSDCHALEATGAAGVGADSLHTDADGSGGTYTAGNCQDCHAGHADQAITGDVIVPNNATVGISYSHGGISLGGTGTVAWINTKTSEAGICWGCHVNNSISEWGVNTDTNGAVNNNYDFGSLSGAVAPGWVDAAGTTGATWNSAVTDFAYKQGAIQSTHSANAGVGAMGLDSAGDIRCSYCHNVHKGTAGDGSTIGAPFLRGTWMGSPFKEDGAPQSGTTFTGVDFGVVPRGDSVDRSMATEPGGFWINQNAYETDGSTLVTIPTADTYAGLCALCHDDDSDGLWTGAELASMDSDSSAATDWVSGLDGHANTVAGATRSTTVARNIFDARKGTGSAYSDDPSQHYNLMVEPGDNGTYGFRGESNGHSLLPTMGSKTPKQYNTDNWGVDETGATVDSTFHQFTCAKCHNPHASRLPRLMITNCLDTKHNTWDDDFQLNPYGTWNTDRSLSNWTSAQNCHRRAGIADGSGPEPVDCDAQDYAGAASCDGTDDAVRGPGNNADGVGGWNNLTPWTN